MTLDLVRRYLIMNNEDTSGLDKVFNVVEDAEVVPEKNKLHLKKPVEGDDVIKDYEYARGNLYSLIDKGQEAVNGALDLAMSSDHPRAVSYTHLTLPTIYSV